MLSRRLAGYYQVINIKVANMENTNELISNILDDVSLDKNLIIQLIAKEDKRFFKHCGVDVIRIVGALISNFRAWKIKEGASTISQQVYDIKHQNISLQYKRKRTFSRKIKQIIFALKLEKKETKKNILEYYINNVYLGGTVFGFKSACSFYFKKSGLELRKDEIYFLLKRVQRPNDLSY